MRQVACLYFPKGMEDAALTRLAEACLRFSSQVALRKGRAVFVETGRSRLLYGEESLKRRLDWLAARYGQARLALGRHAAEALALARHGGGDPKALPLEALSCYASPFHEDMQVEAYLTPMLAALKGLGLFSLGRLLALPPRSIGERFGADMALLRERVEGSLGMAWPRFTPGPRLEEREELRDPETLAPIQSLETLLFHLKRACDRLAARLRGRGLRAARLLLILEGESRRRAFDLPLALPQGSPSALLALLRERLEQEAARNGLLPAVGALSLEATEQAPGLGGQAGFFDSREREVEAWNSLVDRLSQKLGPDQVFLAELVQRYLPERAWRKVIKEPQEASPPVSIPSPPRPTRLLPRPIPLLRQGDEIVQPSQKRRWHARSWEGPERISGEWWSDGFSRDYFRVPTDEGPELWIYASAQAGPSESFWLHGYFD